MSNVSSNKQVKAQNHLISHEEEEIERKRQSKLRKKERVRERERERERKNLSSPTMCNMIQGLQPKQKILFHLKNTKKMRGFNTVLF